MVDEKRYKIINGDSLKVLDTIEPNSIDAIVTDPPYGLTSITKRFGKPDSKPNQFGKDGSFARLAKGFMGKEWDGSGIEYNVELWAKALKVLKPGGYLLAFGGTRTYHRIACAIEDAGFEIRDTIMWLYGSGFPKSMNIGLMLDKKNGVESKVIGKGKSGSNSRALESARTTTAGDFEIKQAQNEWDGWGTCLKPAFEPIIMARKPFKGNLVDNVLENRCGGLNIDECRIETNDDLNGGAYRGKNTKQQENATSYFIKPPKLDGKEYDAPIGRFPANVILTYDETDFDEVCGGLPDTVSTYNESGPHEKELHRQNGDVLKYGYKERTDSGFNDSGSAARYFYCAKASKKDRDDGLIDFEIKSHAEINGRKEGSLGAERQYGGGTNPYLSVSSPRHNIHPTVKPVELMQYLVRLVTPKGGTVLDIFNGSGSTGKAVAFENRERDADYKYIGIELDPEYCEISKGRIDYAVNKFEYDLIEEIEEQKKTGQLSLFDFGFGENDEEISNNDNTSTD